MNQDAIFSGFTKPQGIGKPAFVPSPHQEAIFDAILRENVIVHAVAGSGKTTTIVEALRRLPKTDSGGILPPSTLFLAFNKDIADVLRTKCPSSAQCKTFHALGLAALKRVVDPALASKREWVDSGKVRKKSYTFITRDDPDREAIWKLVSLCKSVAKRPDEIGPQTISDFADHFQLTLEEPRMVEDVVQKLLLWSSNELSTIDFDDMLYLPIVRNAPFDLQDFIFVDEAQDTNDIQLAILERLMKPASATSLSSPSRLCAVGDPAQAIYGFRGANSDSMQRISDRFSCRPYPLSVSWRCSIAAVEEARKILTQPI